MLHAEGFKSFLIFLVAAGIVVPLFHRVRISPVLGFLLLGVALGPHGLGRLTPDLPLLTYVTFDDPQRASAFAELGIIFLLFLLGLELSLQRLWQLRRYVLGAGLAQVALTTLAVGFSVRAIGGETAAAIVLGLCLALSSTAVVMQILIEQSRAATHVGRVALSVLLFQDLMVVPILYVIGVLAGGAGRDLMTVAGPFLLALAAVPVLMVAGRYLVRPLLRSAGRTGSRDLILALVLLFVLGIAASTEALGLSAALGAFLAGLLLSESEYSHHIEVDVAPFKGLLLGIFFITVGTSVDPAIVAEHFLAILGGVAGLIALKAAIMFGVARLFGIARGPSAELALLLAQAGEFAFVAIGIAQYGGLLSGDLGVSAIAVVALSMIATPGLALLARAAGEKLTPADKDAAVPDGDGSQFEDHVVIGGFGRVGQTLARLLESENVPFVALDANAELVAQQRQAGRAVYFGDASRAELLERAGARNARAFVVTLDSSGAAERMVREIHRLRPDAAVLARAKTASHAARLTELGARGATPEFLEASLQLGARLLEALGVPDEAVVKRLADIRNKEMTRLEAG